MRMNFLIKVILIILFHQTQCMTEAEYFSTIGINIAEFPFSNNWESSSFQLSVRMNRFQTQVSFWLKENTSGGLYHKIYSTSDVGGQLSQDMTINDLFTIFVPPSTRRTYFFDAEIQSSRPGYSFIVRRGGQIEAMANKTIAGVRKMIVSVLKLNVIQGGNSGNGYLQEEIKQMKNESEAQKAQIRTLKSQNQKLKQDVASLQSDMEDLKEQSERLIDKISELMVQSFQIENDMSRKSQDPQTTLQNFKNINLNTVSSYINKFQVQGNVITYIGEDRTWTQILGSTPINLKSIVKIKVKKALRRQFYFGVINVKYNAHRWSRLIPGASELVYYNAEGEIWEGTRKVKTGGTSVLEGDTIELSLDINKSEISWRVNGFQKTSYVSDFFQDWSVLWMPYFALYNANDSIEYYG